MSHSWAWKTVLLRAVWTKMIWVKKFQSGTIFTNELQKILVVSDTEYDHFCPCPKLLNEAKLQSFGLIVLAEATISR